MLTEIGGAAQALSYNNDHDAQLLARSTFAEHGGYQAVLMCLGDGYCQEAADVLVAAAAAAAQGLQPDAIGEDVMQLQSEWPGFVVQRLVSYALMTPSTSGHVTQTISTSAVVPSGEGMSQPERMAASHLPCRCSEQGYLQLN